MRLTPLGPREKSNEGFPKAILPHTPQRTQQRTASQHFTVQKSILKNKTSEVPAPYASSRSTHATPDSSEPFKTDPGFEIDHSDSERAIHQIILERKAPQRAPFRNFIETCCPLKGQRIDGSRLGESMQLYPTRKESGSYLDSLQKNMQAIKTQDFRDAKKLDQRRRHIKNMLLSTLISHSDDFEEATTSITEASLVNGRCDKIVWK